MSPIDMIRDLIGRTEKALDSTIQQAKAKTSHLPALTKTQAMRIVASEEVTPEEVKKRLQECHQRLDAIRKRAS